MRRSAFRSSMSSLLRSVVFEDAKAANTVSRQRELVWAAPGKSLTDALRAQAPSPDSSRDLAARGLRGYQRSGMGKAFSQQGMEGIVLVVPQAANPHQVLAFPPKDLGETSQAILSAPIQMTRHVASWRQ